MFAQSRTVRHVGSMAQNLYSIIFLFLVSGAKQVFSFHGAPRFAHFLVASWTILKECAWFRSFAFLATRVFAPFSPFQRTAAPVLTTQQDSCRKAASNAQCRSGATVCTCFWCRTGSGAEAIDSIAIYIVLGSEMHIVTTNIAVPHFFSLVSVSIASFALVGS